MSRGARYSNTNCVYFVRAMTSPERKLGITDGRVSQASPDPVLAHRAQRDAHSVLPICMTGPATGPATGPDPERVTTLAHVCHVGPRWLTLAGVQRCQAVSGGVGLRTMASP